MALTEPADPGLIKDGSDLRARPRTRGLWLIGGGTDGNEQLTATLGALLLVLFAALGITIVLIGQLMWWHLFIGVVVVGPVMVKLASTGYRFARYYTWDQAYRRKGPPHPILRLMGPAVVGSTLGVLLTGLVLLVDGPAARSPWDLLHKGFFFIWLGAMGIHVLGHLAELPGGMRAVRTRAEEAARRHRGTGARVRNAAARRAERAQLSAAASAGSVGRTMLIVGSLALGLVLAIAFLPDFGQWTSNTFQHLSSGH